jgi:hypothetical protein
LRGSGARSTLPDAMRLPCPRSPLIALLAGGALLAAPAASQARHGGDDGDVRASGTCAGPAVSELRLRSDDGSIEARFEARGVRRGTAWRVVVVQERRVVWRGTIRARRGGSVRVERRLADLSGADGVSVRASGPQGVTCRAQATLPGP